MKKINSGITLLLVLSFFGFSACKKETPPAFQADKKDPEIFFSSPAFVPIGQHQYVTSGNYLAIDIRFEDDVALSDYFISVSPRTDIPYLKTKFDQWNPTFVGLLDGNVDGFNTSVFIAEDPISGPYQFVVTVFDKSGKSSTKTTYLYIKNRNDTIIPFVTITQPDPNNVQTISIGNNMIVKGNASDNNAVDDITIRLRNIGSNGIVNENQVFIDTLYSGSVNIDTFMYVDPAVAPGLYDLEIIARDRYQNPYKSTSRIILQ